MPKFIDVKFTPMPLGDAEIDYIKTRKEILEALSALCRIPPHVLSFAPRSRGCTSGTQLPDQREAIALARDDLEDRGVITPPRALRQDELKLLKPEEDS